MVKRKSEVALTDTEQHKAVREKYMKTDRVSSRLSVKLFELIVYYRFYYYRLMHGHLVFLCQSWR